MKRQASPGDDATPSAAAKRKRGVQSPGGAASPPEQPRPTTCQPTPASPTPTKQAKAVAPLPRGGRRGAALLAAAGVSLPPAASPPKLSSKKGSAAKPGASPSGCGRRPTAGTAAPGTASAPDPLLQQLLPKKFVLLEEMFTALQTVYDMARKRGQRTSYQNLKPAVEEACGRRFLTSHLAQLQHLLPEALCLEWIRLPASRGSSRTEPHLLITLDAAAAVRAVAREARGAGWDIGAEVLMQQVDAALQAPRQLLRRRLASHLLGSYRQHLAGRAGALRSAGDTEAAAQLEAAAAQAPPLSQFVAPYPEGAEEVPEQQLPPRPDAPTPGRGASPLVLGSARLEMLPGTPATSSLAAPPTSTAARLGRPPLHPGTVERNRLMQRRLSFGAAAAAEATAAAAAAAAAGMRTARPKPGGTPLDKLHASLGPAPSPAKGLQAQQAEELAAAGLSGELDFSGSIMSQEDAALLASLPEELRRRSTDGIISMDSLRMLEVNEQQHQRLSSKEAEAQREVNAALGALPRTFNRLQRIFGAQGPNALKLRDVLQRMRSGSKLIGNEHLEQQLQALAEHAPDYLTLRAYGACGTPAVWISRSCNADAIMHRLKGVAEARTQ